MIKTVMPQAQLQPRATCSRCRRAAPTCYCDHLAPQQSRTRACILQHPRESKVAIGTARMAHLSLPNSELHQGVDFSDHPRVRQIAAAADTAVLFPGPGAIDPATLAGRPPATLIVVDGTWPQARKLLKANPFLRQLPRLGFRPPRPSNYRIRREPADEFVSTIEAMVHVLGALEGDADRFVPILAAFDRMVDLQLEYIARRPGPPRSRRPTRRRPRVDGTVAELRARRDDVVAIHCESNAYPIESRMPGTPELLQLLALRPATGERFEAFLSPLRPIAPNAPAHLEIPLSRLLEGEPRHEALARFRAFLRDSDLFCGWGLYAIDLLRAEGGPERAFSDLRLAATRRLARRPGGVEQALRLLGRSALPAPLGVGRGGRRLASLAAVLEELSADATT
jgi:DTW domain-containing protein YfiP